MAPGFPASVAALSGLAALAELFTALRPGGLLAVVEVIFDPHFQSRRRVTGLAFAAGFRERAFFGRRLAYVIHFEKPETVFQQPGQA